MLGIQTLATSYAGFPGTFAESYMENGSARTRTSALRVFQHHRQLLNLLYQCLLVSVSNLILFRYVIKKKSVQVYLVPKKLKSKKSCFSNMYFHELFEDSLFVSFLAPTNSHKDLFLHPVLTVNGQVDTD